MERLRFLEKELRSPRPFLHPAASAGPEADAVLGCYRVLADNIANFGERGIGALIVSMTRRLSDLLVVYLQLQNLQLLHLQDNVGGNENAGAGSAGSAAGIDCAVSEPCSAGFRTKPADFLLYKNDIKVYLDAVDYASLPLTNSVFGLPVYISLAAPLPTALTARIFTLYVVPFTNLFVVSEG